MIKKLEKALFRINSQQVNMKKHFCIVIVITIIIQSLQTTLLANTIVQDIQIHLRNAPLNPEPILQRAREHIQIYKGNPLSQTNLSKTIKSLKQTKLFKDITVEHINRHDGIVIVLQMTACSVIKDIQISGAFPLFERDVLNVMTVSPGQIWYPAQVNTQIERITSLYKREGFIHSKIDIQAHKDIHDGYYVIHVTIDTGDCAHLDNLMINGNNYARDLFLKAKMKTYQLSYIPGNAGCFKEKNLRSDVQSLVAWYRNNGFADIVIDSTINRHSQGVDVNLDILEGPQYRVHFVGNQFFSDKTLNKTVTIFSKGNRNDSALRRSIRAIQKKYHEQGFLQANLHIANRMIVNQKPYIQHIWFIIHEGTRACVNKIEITGNHILSKKQIQKSMQTQFPGFFGKTPFQPDTLNDDIPAIKAFYYKHGFLKAKIDKTIHRHENNTDISIQIRIHEGPRTFVRSVSFSGDLDVVQTLNMAYLINQPLNEKAIQNYRQSIEAHISDKGYPYVSVQEKMHLTSDYRQADVIFHIHKGKNVRIGHLYFHGNFKTKTSELRDVLAAKPGDNFSLSKTLKAQQNLRDMKIFNSVKLTPLGLKEKKDEIHLFVEVEEKKPLFLELGGGYKTEKGAFGHTKMGDKNLFGKNKNAWIRFEQSEVGYQGEFNIHDPDLFGERIDTSFGYDIERLKEFNKNYGTQVYGWSLNLNRNWSKTIRSDLNFRYERRRKFLRGLPENDDSDLSKEELKPRSLLVTSPVITYDSRDSFIQPKNGIYASYAMDISKGISNSLDDFIRYYLEIRTYHQINEKLVLAGTGRFQTIRAYGSLERIPEDQLLYLGGSSDVRGFKENMFLFDEQDSPIGGETILSGSIEARYSLGFNFEGFIFIDAGQMLDMNEELLIKSIRSSTGGGLRYHTPIGPIGIMYGIKNSIYGNEDRGRLHFAVGYSF
ncbi:MAG: outer membrane surface antigen protein [Candidatus Magnetoglobus multicellularis str. Araruama]|uniref:Outer membrane protein assembly factor BamA n=1 Tax=Candidatus Magnetoglobus multicellularis str. Araruama TaxID=890399 RepID=A0A1V1PGG8_9BACT|nr:MAG: outer membrane surface antigen protein [Candidatus Magnetoglobus multicellularis str. Araruama]